MNPTRKIKRANKRTTLKVLEKAFKNKIEEATQDKKCNFCSKEYIFKQSDIDNWFVVINNDGNVKFICSECKEKLNDGSKPAEV